MTEPRRTAIEAGLAARVAAGVRYIVSGVAPTDWFGPMQPLPPAAPPAIAGRSFDFPVGANLRIQPRPDETISFADLRGLADGYDLLRLVIETRKDQIAKLDWTIRPRDSKRSGLDDPRLKAVGDFLTYPDREHDFETWLRLLLEDLLVIDAPTLYVRRDQGSALYALEVVDGATIKRVIDERGRTPQPPDVAYQQVLKGIPAIDYTTDELIYRPRNPRPHKIYGFSPVEQAVMTVNVALRRQVAQLQYYTEGNVPEAMIGVPETWSPDQIRQFQEYWDSLLEGNTAARRHAKFVPAGMKPTFTREPMLKDEYDEWLARVICFAFSVAPTPFVRDNNRATAQTTRAAALTEGLAPLLRWVKRLMDEVIARHLGYSDLEFVWSDEKDDDPAEQARINDTYVRSGIKSVDEVRTELGLAPVSFGNAIYTGQGAVPLKDVGKTAAPEPAAKLARDDALAKYSEDQPRLPAGEPGGGRWTSDDAGADGKATTSSGRGRETLLGDAGNIMTDASNADEQLAQAPGNTTASGASKVNWKKIGEWEGNRLDGYIPKKGDQIIGNSGVTIGMGVDLGQMNQKALDALDIPQDLKDKLQPYLGLKRADAEKKLDGDAGNGIPPAPLTLSQDEVDQLNAAVQKKSVDEIRREYDAAIGTGKTKGDKKFDDIPESAQTVMLSLHHQWGEIWKRTQPADLHSFWQAATDQDWEKAQSVLRAWAPKVWNGSAYTTRRTAEADYLGTAVAAQDWADRPHPH